MARDKDDVVTVTFTLSVEARKELEKRQQRYGCSSLEETILFELRLYNIIDKDGILEELPPEG